MQKPGTRRAFFMEEKTAERIPAPFLVGPGCRAGKAIRAAHEKQVAAFLFTPQGPGAA
ncbi:MAG TPA: hypothetical protein VHK69_19195 [Chitinophagaceae bacterium]|jgi:hypothetical protein|nr:hypothetical protein [Chitinophagaceae bacterium]